MPRHQPRQLSLFDVPAYAAEQPVPVPPRDPSVEPAAKPRLSRQCEAILALLRTGPRTNRELAEVALKYTGRISDLRDVGFGIDVVSHDHATGLTVYELRHEPR